MILKCFRNARRQFFRASHHKTQTSKIFGRDSPCVSLQKRRRSQHHRNLILTHQCADGSRIQRAGMVHDSDSHCARQSQSSRESERVKERQDSQNAVIPVQHKDLIQLLDVRCNVILREQYAFGIAGRSTGKNNCRHVIEFSSFLISADSLDRANRKK